MLMLVIFIIFVALVFDFLNGFHDSANSIATIVSTRVLTPRMAVLWAAFFNLVAALLFDVHIAKTMGQGLVDLTVVNEYVILGGLVGAIAWNLITWYYGIPSSSSHALIGGYGGAAVAKAGFGSIIAAGWIKTLIFIVIAPVLGMVLGYILQVAVLWVVRHKSYSKVDGVFRKLQLTSAALYSLGHGTNDAQKTMGIVTGLLVTAGILQSFQVPFWVIGLSHTAIALGTLFGGWRICENYGVENHQAETVRWLLRGNSWRDYAPDHGVRGDRGQHDSHHRRGYHGRRCNEENFGSPVGSRRDDDLGMDPHDPCLGNRRCGDVRTDRIHYIPDQLDL